MLVCPFGCLLNNLCSNVISFSGSKPKTALKILLSAERCFASALTTGVPGGVSGALSMKLSTESTEWKPRKLDAESLEGFHEMLL